MIRLNEAYVKTTVQHYLDLKKGDSVLIGPMRADSLMPDASLIELKVISLERDGSGLVNVIRKAYGRSSLLRVRKDGTYRLIEQSDISLHNSGNRHHGKRIHVTFNMNCVFTYSRTKGPSW